MTAAALMRSELRKLTTTRLLVGYLAAAAALGATGMLPILLAGVIEAEAGSAFDPATVEVQRQFLAGGGNALLLATLFGTVVGAREYRHGTAVRTFLAGPRRRRTMLARAVPVGAAAAMIGLLVGAAATAAVVVSLRATGVELLVGGSTLLRGVAVAPAVGLLGGVLGLAVGAMVRNAATALVGVVVGLLIAEPILANTVEAVATWLPSTLVAALAGSPAPVDPPGVVTAAVLLTAYAAVPFAAALVDVERRDVI